MAEQYVYIYLEDFVVMPNHFHGIIKIINPRDFVARVNCMDVGIGRDLSLPSMKIKSLSELIGAFKTTSSKLIHQAGAKRFKWQRSFYDAIIWNLEKLYQVKWYIKQNPERWKKIGTGGDLSLHLY